MNDQWDVQVVVPVAGKSDEELRKEFGEIIRACQPTWVLIEYDAQGNPAQMTFLRTVSHVPAHEAA